MSIRCSLLLLHLPLLLLPQSALSTPPSARLPSGTTLVGVRQESDAQVTGGGTVDIFKGIQYARVEQRFAPSVAVTGGASGGVIHSTEFGPICVQNDASWPVDKPRMDEQCLFLNVYRPPSSPTAGESLLPTMVWVHGGGFTSGAGSAFDPTNLAVSQNVVVVTLNYRLGPLGFLMTDDSGKGGMNGILDQVQALRWVQKNIAAFGGDPNRVTIFGESAGSLSVCALAVIPAAKGLMRRAILESGICTGLLWGPATVKHGWEKTEQYLHSMGATDVVALRNRAAFPADKFKIWMPQVCLPPTCVSYGWGVDPSVLGGAMSMASRYSVGREAWNVDALLMGANTFDGLGPWFTRLYPFFGIDPSDPEKYRTLVRAQTAQMFPLASSAEIDQTVASVLQTYDAEHYQQFHNPHAASFVQYSSDLTIVCPMKNLAGYLASASLPTFVYAYGHLNKLDVSVQQHIVDPDNAAAREWASHTAEMTFVFGNDHAPELGNNSHILHVPFSPSEIELVKTVQSFWGSFARGAGGTQAEPNLVAGKAATGGINVPEWIPVNAGESSSSAPAVPRKIMQLNLNPVMIESWRDAQCGSIGASWTSEGGVYPPSHGGMTVGAVVIVLVAVIAAGAVVGVMVLLWVNRGSRLRRAARSAGQQLLHGDDGFQKL